MDHHKPGRKPNLNPAKYRYSVNLNSKENARFQTLFEQSGLKSKSRFINHCILDKPIKVVTVDKSTLDVCLALTDIHSQIRYIGVNYNQTVKALKTNFSEKRAFALLKNLEKETVRVIQYQVKILDHIEKLQNGWLQK